MSLKISLGGVDLVLALFRSRQIVKIKFEFGKTANVKTKFEIPHFLLKFGFRKFVI